jgi:hypothetical protein
VEVVNVDKEVEFNLDDNQILDYIKYHYNLKPGEPGVLRRDFMTDPFQAVLVDNLYRVLKYDLYIIRIFRKKYNKIKTTVRDNYFDETNVHYSLYNSYTADLYENRVFNPAITFKTNFSKTHNTNSNDYNASEYQSLWYNKPDDYISKYNRSLLSCYDHIYEYKLMYRQHHILYCLLRGTPLYKIDPTYTYHNATNRIDFDPMDYIIELAKNRITNINDPTYEI